MEELERILYLKDGDKYDHRADPDDVTGLCEADHALRDQLLKLGYAVRWAIDGRYRLTQRGKTEMQRRREVISKARQENSVGPLLPSHEAVARRHFKQETEEELAARAQKLKEEHGNDNT